MMRPIKALIDLRALRSNLGIARARAPGSRIWAVVKADAYGHGLECVQPALAGADGLALLELDAALAARERGWTRPLLMLEGFFEAAELPLFARHRLSAVVHHEAQLVMLESIRLAEPLDIYLKLNTGMNRLGFPVQTAAAVAVRLRASGNTAAITLMTHYADADGERGVAAQVAVFAGVAKALALPVSSANSAALLRFASTHGDWVRPGILLYGCSPFEDESAATLGLRPVMTLSSRIIAVQALEAGARLGYAGKFLAPAPMRVGVVACGYADGYPRHAPEGTAVLVDGVRSRTLGGVSMDMLFVDLRECPGADVGTAVTLWGEGLSADEVAASAGTVSYELLCGLARRVPVSVLD